MCVTGASGSKFFPLREVPILKRDAIEDNNCFIQLSPFDVRSLFSALATPLAVTFVVTPRNVCLNKLI